MKIISHRGNLNGRIPSQENHPSYIQTAIDNGYDVEIDVWWTDGRFYLGHDEPSYEIDKLFLVNHKIWCHAKNKEALSEMLKIGAHCFWHENDSYTMTNKAIPWCINGKWIDGGVTVVSENMDFPYGILGICTDYAIDWSRRTK